MIRVVVQAGNLFVLYRVYRGNPSRSAGEERGGKKKKKKKRKGENERDESDPLHSPQQDQRLASASPGTDPKYGRRGGEGEEKGEKKKESK